MVRNERKFEREPCFQLAVTTVTGSAGTFMFQHKITATGMITSSSHDSSLRVDLPRLVAQQDQSLPVSPQFSTSGRTL